MSGSSSLREPAKACADVLPLKEPVILIELLKLFVVALLLLMVLLVVLFVMLLIIVVPLPLLTEVAGLLLPVVIGVFVDPCGGVACSGRSLTFSATTFSKESPAASVERMRML